MPQPLRVKQTIVKTVKFLPTHSTAPLSRDRRLRHDFKDSPPPRVHRCLHPESTLILLFSSAGCLPTEPLPVTTLQYAVEVIFVPVRRQWGRPTEARHRCCHLRKRHPSPRRRELRGKTSARRGRCSSRECTKYLGVVRPPIGRPDSQSVPSASPEQKENIRVDEARFAKM